MDSELKPCPCCEHDAKLIPHVGIKRIRYRVYCTNDGCGLKTNSFSSETEAIAAWNTRADTCTADQLQAFGRMVLEKCAGVAWCAHPLPTDMPESPRNWEIFCYGKDCATAAIRSIDIAGMVQNKGDA